MRDLCVDLHPALLDQGLIKAKRIGIRLARAAQDVELTVTDDGVGFATDRLEEFAGAGGLGVVMMRERAEFAGARFEIASRPGHGTRIRVTLPFEKAFNRIC